MEHVALNIQRIRTVLHRRVIHILKCFPVSIVPTDKILLSVFLCLIGSSCGDDERRVIHFLLRVEVPPADPHSHSGHRRIVNPFIEAARPCVVLVPHPGNTPHVHTDGRVLGAVHKSAAKKWRRIFLFLWDAQQGAPVLAQIRLQKVEVNFKGLGSCGVGRHLIGGKRHRHPPV